ncbi:MAG: ABC transporter ATP-binding protein [Myxococcales bacterium]|nr:ABC transporter ATP-binding protein [Myxococcales bacterium]MCB9733248.1 ABC transporter ATP-binding protein [Deltaproteobacteria bacterium]
MSTAPAPSAGVPVLEMRGVTKRFGGLTAVEGFEARLGEHEVVGLIGPNGAGKTTVFNLITGVYELTAGAIAVRGRDTKGLRPDQITSLGVARTFQNIRLFRRMSVLENVQTAMDLRLGYGILASVLRTRRFREREREITEKSRALLDLVGLADDADERAGALAYGEQRRLEIARALATDPRLLILDEPAAGMNPQETDELGEMLHVIRKRHDLTLLLIEHDMKFVMRMCERIIVLDYGRIIATGTPAEVRANPAVIAAYLGDEE